jgi:hypothetical protein
MEPLWTSLLITSQSESWSMNDSARWLTFTTPQFHMLANRMWSTLSPKRQGPVKAGCERLLSGLEPAPETLAGLAALTETAYLYPQWRRDALDMARTVANRALTATVLHAACQIEAWRLQELDAEAFRPLADLNRGLLDALCGLLAQSDEFSMAASLQRLEEAQALGGVSPTLNPHTELTLKGNAENDYCRSHHYELARYVYRKELDVFWDHVLKRLESGDRVAWPSPPEFREQAKIIEDEFYATPLAQMAPQAKRGPREMADALGRLEALVGQLLERASSEP